jgi:cytoskeletal protein CcmA (bactofilin family)
MRRKSLCIALLLLLALGAAGAAAARDILQGDVCTVAANERYSGNVFALCRTLVIEGSIEGSLYAIAVNADIRGRIQRDVYIVAGQLDLRGTLGEDLIFAGPVLRVHPQTRFMRDISDLITLSLSSTIEENVQLPGSLLALSYQMLLYGDVGEEVNFWGSALTIDGVVEGDVNATVGDAQSGASAQIENLLIPFRFLNFDVNLVDPGLIVTENARIDGALRYTGPSLGVIEGELAEVPVFTPVVTRPDFTQGDLLDEGNTTWLGGYLGEVLQEIITLGLIGVVAVLVAPRPLQAPIFHLRQHPLSSLGIGILTFILSFAIWLVALLLLLLLLIIVVGLRLGDLGIVGLIAIGVINVGGAGVFYFFALYISRVIVCLALGRLLVRLTLGDDGSPRILFVSLLVGVTLLSLLAWLPVIGPLVTGVVLVLGLGALTMTITRIQFREPQRAPAQPTSYTILPNRPGPARQIPPPPAIDDRSTSPGMDNLPDGFNWWGEDER